MRAAAIVGDTEMHARTLRRQVLLSTTIIVGALTGYGGRAYGQGCMGAGSVYTCSGAATATQEILEVDDATASTVAGFSNRW